MRGDPMTDPRFAFELLRDHWPTAVGFVLALVLLVLGT